MTKHTLVWEVELWFYSQRIINNKTEKVIAANYKEAVKKAMRRHKGKRTFPVKIALLHDVTAD